MPGGTYTIRCVVRNLPCPNGHSASDKSPLLHVRPRRQLNSKKAGSLRVHQVHAEAAEEQRGYLRLPSVQEQAAEHRKSVLSNLSKSGMLFVVVRFCFSNSLFNLVKPALVYL